jgi:hypothetical protein
MLELVWIQAGEHSLDVRIDNGNRLPEGEAGHGIRSVASDARKLSQFNRGLRHFSVEAPHQAYGKLPQSDGPIVVPHALPAAYDLGAACLGELLKRGKTLQERWIFYENATYLCLLKHDL